jgi:hypothetical protein
MVTLQLEDKTRCPFSQFTPSGANAARVELVRGDIRKIDLAAQSSHMGDRTTRWRTSR